MKLYLDTNVLIDILMESRKFNVESSSILQMVEKGAVEGVLSTQSILDTAYIFTQQTKGSLDAFKDALRYILAIITVTQIEEDNIKAAIRDSNTDFEDAAQIDCALETGCDAIISSDQGMKNHSSIPVYTPKEFCDLVFVE